MSIDEILFPRSTVQKLAKSILTPTDGQAATMPAENMSLTKDSLIAVQRSATVFVSHLMFHAQQTARDLGRKNVNSQDILHALERADLAGFVPEVKQKLSTFEADADAKKKQKSDAKDAAAAASTTDEPAAKKRRDNASNGVLQTGAEGQEDDDEEDDNTIEEDETRNDDATVLPPNGNDDDDDDDEEEEASVANPIALLGQEEKELGGLEPEDTTGAHQPGNEDPETEEE